MALVLFEDTVSDVLAVMCGFHAMYWFFRQISPLMSATYRSMLAPDKGYWDVCLCAWINGFFLSGLCYNAATSGGFWTKWDLFQTTPESSFCISAFIGYLLSDSILALYFNSGWAGWKPNIAHHIICIGGLVQMTNCHDVPFGHCFGMSAGLMEITSPFIHNRWFMDKLGYKGTPGFIINGLVIVAAWFVFRIAFYAYTFYEMAGMRQQLGQLSLLNAVAFVACSCMAFMLQVMWFQKICIGAMKALGLIKPSQKRVDKTK